MAKKEKKPEIRFKGFSDEWEQREFDDIIHNLTGGASIKPEDYQEKGIRTVPKGAVNSEGVADLKGSKYVTAEFFERNISSKVETGNLVTSLRDLVPAAPNMGRIVRIVGKQEIFLMPQGVYKIEVYAKINKDFVIAYSNSDKYRSIISQEKNGSTQVHIRNGEFLKIKISIPLYQEQLRIGSFIANLDNLIILHQRKLDKLINIKKSMLEKMFPKSGAVVPEIRFKGFSEDWEQREYSETFTKIPNNTLSRAELNYDSGLAKNVHYGDVLIKFGELLNVTKDRIPYITDDAVVNKIRSSKLQSGDVIIADAAEDETVGKCIELVNIGEETVMSGLHTIPSRPTLSFASGYLGYFMNSSAYHNQLLRLMQGTKVSSISKAALQDTFILYPNDKVEQYKISEFFQQLNNLITLHQRKLEKLKNIKKSCLDKMFV